MAYLPISDYGVIGNMETAALVGKDGSIDWFCSPTIDSPSVFAGILDDVRGGHWQISPVGTWTSDQEYLEHSNVLATTFNTPDGQVKIVDFMPIADSGQLPEIIRSIQGISGELRMKFQLAPAFDYGRAEKTRVRDIPGAVEFGSGDMSLKLWRSLYFDIDETGAGEFVIIKDQTVVFNLTDANVTRPSRLEPALKATLKLWDSWAHTCTLDQCPLRGPWHEKAVRSGLLLKLLTHRHSGSIAAAPTTSLPESLDGDRNWDYRFAWLRDSILTIQALLSLGSVKEAQDFMKWIMNVCTETTPENLGIMYKLHDNAVLTEETLDHLSGYRGIGPVRIGNAAHTQRQLDIYGELVRGVGLYIEIGGDLEPQAFSTIYRIIDYVADIWREPDAGIWEIRGPSRHYVYSKVMCWAALDQGVKLAEHYDPGDERLLRWSNTRDEIKKTVLEKGLSPSRQAFTQYFGAEHMDAANLLIPLTGFLPFTDERISNTIQAIIDDLATDGLVLRYRGDDGLKGQEGAFVVCSFWLVDCLVGSGQLKDAISFFEKITSYCNHVGLLSEEIDVKSGELLGNFPQAFSHIGLINSAILITKALAKVDETSQESGVRSQKGSS